MDGGCGRIETLPHICHAESRGPSRLTVLFAISKEITWRFIQTDVHTGRPGSEVSAQHRPSQARAIYGTESKANGNTSGNAVGALAPKLCDITTPAFYNPGSHPRTLSFWLILDRGAGQAPRSHSPLTDAFTMRPHGAGGIWSLGRGPCSHGTHSI